MKINGYPAWWWQLKVSWNNMCMVFHLQLKCSKFCRKSQMPVWLQHLCKRELKCIKQVYSCISAIPTWSLCLLHIFGHILGNIWLFSRKCWDVDELSLFGVPIFPCSRFCRNFYNVSSNKIQQSALKLLFYERNWLMPPSN